MASGFDLTATARRLLNIEVNTIVRDNMTAEPMPPVPHALLDIAGEYAELLCAVGVNLAAYFTDKGAGAAAAPPVDLETVNPGWVDTRISITGTITISSETFDRLRWAAKWATSHPRPKPPISAANLVLLDRVENNSDSIKQMFSRFDKNMTKLFVGKTRADLMAMTIEPNSYAIATDDLILLQKMWDIGTEEIVAQTVVHVTGDVTTRVQRALFGDGADSVFSIHRQSIDVSVGCWKYLLDAVREIAGTAVKALLGPKA